MKLKKVAAAVLAVGCFGSSALAQDLLPVDNGIFTYHQSPRWRESEEHPLRVLAYVLHPVGWVAREVLFRPLSYFASSSPTTRSVMGYREPFDFRSHYCFDDYSVPDCRLLAPMTSRGRNLPDGDGMEPVEAERQVFFPDINFDFDKSNLNQLGKARVRQVSQLLASVPNLKVVVEGHTDYIGSDEYNMKLGERRANTVRKELTDLGVDASRLAVVSYGESRPLFTEEEDWARAANRRVQFNSSSDAVAQASVPAPAAAAAPADMPPAAH